MSTKINKKSFNKLINETMAEMQAIAQPAVGANYNISSIQNVPAPGYTSNGRSILPTEENEENTSDKDIDIELNLYNNIKSIVLNSKTKKISKLHQILKLVKDFYEIN